MRTKGNSGFAWTTGGTVFLLLSALLMWLFIDYMTIHVVAALSASEPIRSESFGIAAINLVFSAFAGLLAVQSWVALSYGINTLRERAMPSWEWVKATHCAHANIAVIAGIMVVVSLATQFSIHDPFSIWLMLFMPFIAVNVIMFLAIGAFWQAIHRFARWYTSLYAT